MALAKSFSHAGLTVNSGYLRISSFSGNKQGILFVLAYQAVAEEMALISKEFYFTPSMDSNFISQAYLHLKTLPEFADAIDC